LHNRLLFNNFLNGQGNWTAAPGISNGIAVEMLNIGCTVARSVTGGSFVGIGVATIPEPGEIIDTFTITAAGTYAIDFDVNCYGSANWGYFRINFDYDTVPNYVGGDLSWLTTFYGNYARYSFKGQVTLAAGSHTVKVEWKVVSGSINCHDASIAGNWVIRGILASGIISGMVVPIEFVEASQPSALLANGLRYTPLIKNNTDYVQFQVMAPESATTLEVYVHYHMSAANAGNVELHLDSLAISPGENPTAALSGGAEFTITPGNDTNMHIVDGSAHASFTIAVTGGDLLVGKLSRTADVQDTHTGNMYITSISVIVGV
jgi:hypothetical protein